MLKERKRRGIEGERRKENTVEEEKEESKIDKRVRKITVNQEKE